MDEQAHAIGLDEAIRFQRDLYLYWREALELSRLPLTTRGYVTRPALRRIRGVLASGVAEGGQGTVTADDPAEAEDARLLYLRRLLERLGLLRAAPDAPRLMAGDRSAMARYLAQPLVERVRICVRLWVAGGWWPDRLDPSAELPRLLTPAPPRIALARRRTLETLAATAPGRLVAIPPATLGTTPTTGSRTRRWRSRPNDRAAHVGSAEGEGETLRAALLGPLAWMGLVALERSADGEPSACRAGVALTALAPETDTSLLAERCGRVIIQPDASLVAYPPLTAPELLTLDTCVDALALDVVARYRLSRPALIRAREAGWSAAGVIVRLEELAQAPLPANIRRTLVDWERQAARVGLTAGVTVLEVRAAEVLDALLADATARAWVARRLTPTAALLVGERVERVRDWLLRHGELPAWLRTDASTSDR